MARDTRQILISYKKRKARRRRIFWCCVAVIILLTVLLFPKKGLVARLYAAQSQPPPASSQTEPDTPSTDTQPQEDTPQETTGQNYCYTSPVPQSDPVDDTYFNDAVFLGDSRTEGMLLLCGLHPAGAFACKGLMVDTVFTKPAFFVANQKRTAIDALKYTNFTKVYIMFGINETGWPYNSVFIEKYSQIIQAVRQVNPSADIYIQQIMPVTQHVSDTHSYIKNQKIAQYNTLLAQLAAENQVYYVDVANAVAPSGAPLPEDAATDGIHLNKTYCQRWLDYLKTHTVLTD